MFLKPWHLAWVYIPTTYRQDLSTWGIRSYEGLGWGCSHDIFETAEMKFRRNGRLSVPVFYCAHGAIILAVFLSCARQFLSCDACNCQTHEDVKRFRPDLSSRSP